LWGVSSLSVKCWWEKKDRKKKHKKRSDVMEKKNCFYFN